MTYRAKMQYMLAFLHASEPLCEFDAAQQAAREAADLYEALALPGKGYYVSNMRIAVRSPDEKSAAAVLAAARRIYEKKVSELQPQWAAEWAAAELRGETQYLDEACGMPWRQYG